MPRRLSWKNSCFQHGKVNIVIKRIGPKVWSINGKSSHKIYRSIENGTHLVRWLTCVHAYQSGDLKQYMTIWGAASAVLLAERLEKLISHRK